MPPEGYETRNFASSISLMQAVGRAVCAGTENRTCQFVGDKLYVTGDGCSHAHEGDVAVSYVIDIEGVLHVRTGKRLTDVAGLRHLGTRVEIALADSYAVQHAECLRTLRLRKLALLSEPC